MLMHHADAKPDGVLTTADLLRLTIEQNVATVGAVVAIEDTHERRFAGAVLADQAVNTAFGDAQIDVRIGLHATKAFADLAKFNRRCR